MTGRGPCCLSALLLIFVRDLSLLFPRLSDAYYHIWKLDFYLFTTWLL